MSESNGNEAGGAAAPGRRSARHRRPRILSDFDGVWTRLQGQARAVSKARVVRLASLAGWPEARVAECLDHVARTIHAHPLEHGWRHQGRITAYADEDPFLMNNALITGIGLLRRHDAECGALVARLEAAGHADLTALGSEIFLEASREFLERNGHDMIDGARDILEALLEVADVVFCTNFTSRAVEATWARYGVRLDGSDPRVALRGNARKQYLGEGTPRTMRFGDRPVAIDRPFYLDAIQSVRPDIVVGDVFSLDHALPLALRASDRAYRHLHCFLCRTPYTPSWSRRLCRGGIDGLSLIDGPAALLTAPVVSSPRSDSGDD